MVQPVPHRLGVLALDPYPPGVAARLNAVVDRDGQRLMPDARGLGRHQQRQFVNRQDVRPWDPGRPRARLPLLHPVAVGLIPNARAD